MKIWRALVLYFLTFFTSQAYSVPLFEEPVEDSTIDLSDFTPEQADFYFTHYLKTFKESSDRPAQGTLEYQKRKAAFMDNIAEAIRYNAKSQAEGRHQTSGINNLFDLSVEEFRNHRLGRDASGNILAKATDSFSKTLKLPFKYSGGPLPDAIDWRKQGLVTGVKDQKQCGSCWIFGTIGALEGYYKQLGNPLTSFSEQHIGSCNGVKPACEGGTALNVYAFLNANNNTLCTEESCPYTSGSGHDEPCTFDLTGHCKKIQISSGINARSVEPGDDRALMEALLERPVSVAINASLRSFMLYKEGIYDDPVCLKNRASSLDHEVLVVGYGVSDQKEPYWIVKNSWGTQWGEEGFIRMRRGKTGSSSDEYNDFCGITLDAVQPIPPEK